MASYGSEVFGPVGWILPAFSEAAAWAFAAANTLTRRRHPGAPTWHLVVGVWVFTGVQALLNFIHGATGGAHGRVEYGLVMAVVAISGITAHQLITAGPRTTRAQRADVKIRRAAARRELAVRRAATRAAVAELGTDGQARLVYRAGTVGLRRRFGRRPSLVEPLGNRVPEDQEPVPGEREPGSGTRNGGLAAEAACWLGGTEAEGIRDSLGTAQTRQSWEGPGPGSVPGGTRFPVSGTGSEDARFARFLAQVRRAVATGRLPARPSRKQVRDLLGCRTQIAGAVRNAYLTTTSDTTTTDDDADGGCPATTSPTG